MRNPQRRKVYLAGGHILLAHKSLLEVMKEIDNDDPAMHELADALTLTNLAATACTQALYEAIPNPRPVDTIARAPLPKGEKPWTETPKPPSRTTESN